MEASLGNTARKPLSILFALSLFVSGCAFQQQEVVSTAADTSKTQQPLTVSTPITQLSDEKIQLALKNAYTKFKNDQSGKNADYIKALAEVDSKLYGISVVTTDGRIFEIGDVKSKFSIQSISKVFTLAGIMQQTSPAIVQEKIGVNATGLAFNSMVAVETIPERTVNPFVNAGAIASTSLIEATDSAQRWDLIKANMDNFAGRELDLNEQVYQSEVNDNLSNQALSKRLESYGRIYSDPLEATTVYTRQCSVNVTSHDLAVMGSVLANHGVNPITGKRIIDADNTPYILAVMATAGLYDNAGSWLYETGTPAKSGVGGGILAIVPGKLSIGVFSPPLDGYGNSVRGQLAAAYIINELNLNPYDASH
jgi:glutaminase